MKSSVPIRPWESARLQVLVAILCAGYWGTAGSAFLYAEEPLPVAEQERQPTDADQETAAEQQPEESSEPAVEAASKAKESEAEEPGQASADASEAEASEAASEPGEPAAATRPKVRLAMFSLKDSMPETTGQVGPFGETRLSLRETISRLDRASSDKSIAGVVLTLENPSLGRGKIEELRSAIGRVRAAGKKTYALLESARPADYLVACACDEIIMPETGIVLLPGIYAEAMFFKGLLGKLGIESEFIHIGDYKGAGEPYSREKFSKPVRENMNELVDSLYDDLVTTIVKDRPLSIAQAKQIIDTGLLTAQQAKDAGLIDRIAYADALRSELADAYEAEALVFVKNYGQKKVDTDFSGPMGLVKLMQAMMGGGSASGDRGGKKIAVVYALGPIMTGKSESDLFGGQIMGSTTIVEALRKANADKQVAAIVLRIDSPGGSALASDLIWHETQVIDKPIVASMGDVAASGGYYIAMGADKIVAAPGTITGSIGVVGGKFAVRGLYDKVGISTETIERGKNSGLFSATGKWTDSQRKVIEGFLEDIYEQFTTKAAQGRDMPLERLRELAGGRIYTGRQAREVGLVDQLGTLQDAIAEAKKLAGIDSQTEVKIEVLPEPTSFFETLFGNLDQEKEVRLGAGLEGLQAVAPELIELARRAQRLRAVFDQPAALVMPFELEIR